MTINHNSQQEHVRPYHGISTLLAHLEGWPSPMNPSWNPWDGAQGLWQWYIKGMGYEWNLKVVDPWNSMDIGYEQKIIYSGKTWWILRDLFRQFSAFTTCSLTPSGGKISWGWVSKWPGGPFSHWSSPSGHGETQGEFHGIPKVLGAMMLTCVRLQNRFLLGSATSWWEHEHISVPSSKRNMDCDRPGSVQRWGYCSAAA